MSHLTRTATIAAEPDAVWEVLADFGAIGEWADNVDHSSLLRNGPVAEGLTRRIQSGRQTLLERIVIWDPPTTLAYEIEGLPSAIRSMRNQWDLADHGHGSTLVALTTTVDAGPRPPQQLVARIACRVAAKQSDVMLAGLTAHLEDHSRV